MKKLLLSIISTAFIFALSTNAEHKNAKDFDYKLVNSKGRKTKPDLKNKEYIVLYYSASWCPPCQKFTPKLVDFYNEVQKDKGSKMNFEVIFVSSDRSKGSMKKYMKNKKMPWPAIAYKKKQKIKTVMKNAPSGIPHIVILGKNGEATFAGSANAGLSKLKTLAK